MEKLSGIHSQAELRHFAQTQYHAHTQASSHDSFQDVLLQAFAKLEKNSIASEAAPSEQDLRNEIAQLKQQLQEQSQVIHSLNQQLSLYDRQMRDLRKTTQQLSAQPPTGSAIPEDPYTLLGVKPGSSLYEIKRAYHQKLKLFHPDRMQLWTQKVNQAYETLSQTPRAYTAS